jgi:acetyltransferase-like isoleucine patch superfamily enzyme
MLRTMRALATLSDLQRRAILDVARWVALEHSMPRLQPTISREAWISPLASVRFAERVEIGCRSAIGPFASVWGGFETAWARIGDEAQIGPGAMVVAGNHRIDGSGAVRRLGFDEADVVVGEGAWVGANAVIIGCRVGSGAVIGAGAIVTCDIPDRAVAVGAPARVVRMRGDG